MKVLVNGLGNIGTTLAGLLLVYKEQLGISEIHACKRTLNSWNRSDYEELVANGLQLHSYSERFDEVIRQVDYIFETTANTVGLGHLQVYRALPNLIGASAQGSEKGFGVPFMSGINDEIIRGEQFVQIVSCNTHGSGAILTAACSGNWEEIDTADFVVVRRSEDLGQHERLVTANVIARHLDSQIGTHHCIDIVDLLDTINVKCNLTSSDITTPSQLLHSVRFNIRFNSTIPSDFPSRIDRAPFLSVTNKFDSNVIFDLGRRYGFQGRLFSHAIVVSNNLLLHENEVKGWAFVPQEGNSIFSTIHAFLLQTKNPRAEESMNLLINDLVRKLW